MTTLEMAIKKIQQFTPEQLVKICEYIDFLEFQANQQKQTPLAKAPQQKQDFFAAAGIWEEKNITLEQIRKDAWGKENL